MRAGTGKPERKFPSLLRVLIRNGDSPLRFPRERRAMIVCGTFLAHPHSNLGDILANDITHGIGAAPPLPERCISSWLPRAARRG